MGLDGGLRVVCFGTGANLNSAFGLVRGWILGGNMGSVGNLLA